MAEKKLTTIKLFVADHETLKAICEIAGGKLQEHMHEAIFYYDFVFGAEFRRKAANPEKQIKKYSRKVKKMLVGQ